MVIDTSAFMEVILGEPSAAAIERALVADAARSMGAPTFVEASLVVEGRLGPRGGVLLDAFVVELGIDVVTFGPDLAHRARHTWRRFGKGRHPAALNFGDCFTYAVAAHLGEPILCVGNDFARTDAALVPLLNT